MLSTWPEITQAIARYPVRAIEAQAISFDWPEQGPATAIFQIVCTELGGRERIVIGVNVLPEAQASSTSALRMNSELSIGAFSAFKGNIVLKHIMTLGRFDEEELHEVVHTMASTVAKAQERLRKQGPVVIQGYAD